MPVDDLPIYLYNILHQHQTTYILLHHLCTNNRQKDQAYQMVIVSMEKMPM